MITMRIAVACMGQGGLDDEVTPFFEASDVFTIVEAEVQTICGTEIVPNESIGAAGARSAALLLEKGVDAVIAGKFDPEYAGIISSAGVTMYRLQNMPVGDAVKHYPNHSTDAKIRERWGGDVPTGYATRTSSDGVTLGARRCDWSGGPAHGEEDSGARQPRVPYRTPHPGSTVTGCSSLRRKCCPDTVHQEDPGTRIAVASSRTSLRYLTGAVQGTAVTPMIRPRQ